MALFDRLCIVIKFENKKICKIDFVQKFSSNADIYDDFNLMKQNDGWSEGDGYC